MLHETFTLSDGGFDAMLHTYILDNSEQINPDRKRPLVLVCPGGGYQLTSDREAEPIAIQLLAQGYHACVLRYSVAPARFPVALSQLAKAIAHIRRHAEGWHVDANRIVVAGFSAGGHLAASIGTFWHEDFLSERTGLTPEAIRPNGLILCYPVITAGDSAHQGSFQNLLGERATDANAREFVSLEKQVTPSMPPVFLWHTYPDQSVPLENALLLMDALRRADIAFEAHIYPKGKHGLSLGTTETSFSGGDGADIIPSVTGWISLAGRWIGELE